MTGNTDHFTPTVNTHTCFSVFEVELDFYQGLGLFELLFQTTFISVQFYFKQNHQNMNLSTNVVKKYFALEKVREEVKLRNSASFFFKLLIKSILLSL